MLTSLASFLSVKAEPVVCNAIAMRDYRLAQNRVVLRLLGAVDRRFLSALARDVAERPPKAIIDFLGRTAQSLTEAEQRRVGNDLADRLLRTSSAKLQRVADAVRAGESGITPVYGAIILFHEVRHLHAMRAARSALDAVIALRSGPWAGAMSEKLAADLALYEARLRHRLDDIGGARALLKDLRVAMPGKAEVLDLEATIAYPVDPAAALDALELRFAAHGFSSKESNTLYADLLRQQGRIKEAEHFLTTRLVKSKNTPDYLPGLANLYLPRDLRIAKAFLTQFWGSFGLKMAFRDGPVSMESIAPLHMPSCADAPELVTVVMTAFNAEAHIALAIRSVLAQTWRNLELLVVDDCSDDRTCAIVTDIAARDPRVRLLRQSRNAGTYVAKNRAIAEARGTYVALHDSDDWWHPGHLERHLTVMRQQPDLLLTSSAWVRMDETGFIALKHNGGYLHFNPASTLFRADVFEKIGYFDSVRIGADTEFIWRFRHYFGRRAEVEIREPLAIGRLHAASLTQSGVGAYNEHNVSPARLEYWECWTRWHRRQTQMGAPLRLDAAPPAGRHERPFDAPEIILP